MCKNIISAKILIYQTIINLIPCSPEVHYTGLTLESNSASHSNQWCHPEVELKHIYILTFCRTCIHFNSLPNDKLLDRSELKAFADNKMNVTKTEILSGIVREHCGKRRKCWLPAFSPFPTMFSKGFIFRVVKSRDCVNCFILKF